jgi:acyl-CoA thioesterase FadM
MSVFVHRLTVRFRDCDSMGHTTFESGSASWAARASAFCTRSSTPRTTVASPKEKTVNVTFDYAAGRTMRIPETTRALLERAR